MKIKIDFPHEVEDQDFPHAIELRGRDGEWVIFIMSPRDTWIGLWDPSSWEIVSMGWGRRGISLDPEAVPFAQKTLQEALAPFRSPPRQQNLSFEAPGCCQCGATLNVIEATEIEKDFGFRMNPQTEPVTWICCVCAGLVCRKCCLTIPNQLPKEYYHGTYCSRLCYECGPQDEDR